MVPSTGYSDGACFVPHTYLPIVLNGKVLGGAPVDVCIHIEDALRFTKAAQDNNMLRRERGVVASLEVCLILPVRGGPFPGTLIHCLFMIERCILRFACFFILTFPLLIMHVDLSRITTYGLTVFPLPTRWILSNDKMIARI
jgi:hypothetical protein